MTDATKRNEKIFQSLSEPILTGDIELNTIWPTTNDVLTYIAFIMTILVSLISGWLFFKQRKLLLLISLLKQSPYAKAVENEYVFLQTTTENPKHISDVIKVTLKWDNVLFALSLSSYSGHICSSAT